MTPPWRTAWVTGASSGIGRALSLQLASEGVTVIASARRTDALHELAATSTNIHALALDATDASAVRIAAETIEAMHGPIDLAVFNAGIGQLMGVDDFNVELAAETMAINYQGLVNGVAAVLPRMRQRRVGHIALMASLAGYRGLPGAAAYSPSKAAAISLAECLHLELRVSGVLISVINPGFVETQMTAKAPHPLPFQISADDAAKRIVHGLKRGKFEIAFPWQLAMLVRLGHRLPHSVYSWIMAPPRSD